MLKAISSYKAAITILTGAQATYGSSVDALLDNIVNEAGATVQKYTQVTGQMIDMEELEDDSQDDEALNIEMTTLFKSQAELMFVSSPILLMQKRMAK
jgi:hypothetical protein